MPSHSVDLNFNAVPEPKCRHCGRDKGQHRSVDKACPSGRGHFPSFYGKTFYEPRKTRTKKPEAAKTEPTAKDTSVIDVLTVFVEDELHGTDLRGYAARDAAKVLIGNWDDALRDGNTDNLVNDVDLVIGHLLRFKEKARELLPVANGGKGTQ